METELSCNYVKIYSEIGALQPAHQVAYSAKPHASGALLKLVHIQQEKRQSVECLCENLSLENAKNMLRYLYENSVGLSSFRDVLQDYNIKVTELV